MKTIFLNATSLFWILLFSTCSYAQSKNYEVQTITFLEVNATINPATHNYLESNFEKLSASQGDMVVVKLDTPGGLVTTTKDILTLIGSVNFPVAVWITPEGASATSAGAIIASGSHVLVMSKGTNIGAATPITMGKDIEQKDAKSKAVNDLVALVRSLSKARGRNADEFEQMISNAKSIDAEDALSKKVIDQIINDQKGLITYLHERSVNVLGEDYVLRVDVNVPTKTITMDPGQLILNIFSNPSTAYVLFIIGAALIYFELQAPGGMVAGALGVICLLLAGIGFQVLPLNFGALGLIILSFILFVMEVYITSFGILTIGGLASLIFGSLFLFRTENSLIDLENNIIYAVVASIAFYVVFIGWYMLKTHIKSKNYYSQEHEEGIISKVLGEKKYQVKVNGEIWNAKSEEDLSVGDLIKILKEDDENLILKVSKK